MNLKRQYGIWGWVWRVALAIVLFPLLVLAILSVLLYIPPVQKWAVDKASDVLSEEMEMEVSIESVRLKCPLDLSLNGMLAVQEGDTVLDAEELALSVRFFPLFSGNIEIDDIHLTNTKLNTRDFIDACRVEGFVGRLALASHSTSLFDEMAVVNYALLKDANINIAMADSVPEDTTESEPLNWTIDLRDVQIDNVRVDFSTPTETIDSLGKPDRMNLFAYVGRGTLHGFIDLGKEQYNVDEIEVSDGELGYVQMVEAKAANINVDSLRYSGTGDLSLVIKQIAANVYPTMEGVNGGYFVPIVETKGRVEMDSVSLSIPLLTLKTEESRLKMKMNMDLNAFDSISPGRMMLDAKALIGRGDIQSAVFGFMPEKDARDLNQTLNQYLPNKPIIAVVEAEGNMQHLEVKTLDAVIEDFAKLQSSATLDKDDLTADATLQAFNGTVAANAEYNMASDAYKAVVGVHGLSVHKLVDMEETCNITGNISAEGKGFDFLDSRTYMSAKLAMVQGNFGKMNLSSMTADASLSRGVLKSNLTCDNNQLKANVGLDANVGSIIENSLKGRAQKESFEGKLKLDVDHADILAMGFIDTALVVSTNGYADFSMADWSSKRPLFLCDVDVKGVDIRTFSDSLTTNAFLLKALTTVDSTDVNFNTGDLSLNFRTPNNLFTFIEQSMKWGDLFSKQMKDRNVDMASLREHMPIMFIDAHAGSQNPVSPLIKEYGMSFSDFSLKARTNPATGISGRGHLYALQYDTIRIDTTYFIIKQDSDMITYKAAVISKNQPMVPGFVALLDGYTTPKDVNAHLRFFNKDREKGLDLGLHAQTVDSAINVKFYPEQPVLGFKQFQLNNDNLVQIQLSRPNPKESPEIGLVHANVEFQSLNDSSFISLQARPNDDNEQLAHAIVRNLNLEGLVNILPFAPKMSGLLTADATYDVHQKEFKVLSDVSLNDFVYEEMPVGNLHSNLVYTPDGADVHTVDASLDYNNIPVATMKGSYSTKTPEGYLDAGVKLAEVPLSLISPFVPDKILGFTGNVTGDLLVQGPTDNLTFNGQVTTTDVHILSEAYSLNLRLDNTTAYIENSRIKFDHYKIYGAGDTPLDFDGYFDFSDFDNMYMSLSLYGYGFKLIEAKRTRKAVLFGDIYGDIVFRVHGSMSDLSLRGVINVLSKTDMTYIMVDTPLSQGDRLEDIVTFVDFNAPPDTTQVKPKPMGIDMRISLKVEEGAKFNCEFSADRQSYITLRSGGQVTMTATPEGVLNVIGRIEFTEGEMKYTLPIIPLKTFKIASGSYVDFNGDVMNPTLNITATERTKAMVSSEGSSARSVAFDVGVQITNTLSDMGLLFTIDAPQDAEVKDELSGYTAEEKNKLAVAMMATGMYLSASNTSGTSSNNALNSFLQSEINSLTGKTLGSIVDVNVGIDNTTYANGETGTDYSFRFTKRFFSDRLNVVVGGKVSSNSKVNQQSGMNSFIDDVSLEWRLDNSATRYVRLFSGKDYNNIVDGVLEKSGVGLLLRKKVDKVTDLFIFRRKENTTQITPNAQRNADAQETQKTN